MGPDKRFFLTHDPITVVEALSLAGAAGTAAETVLTAVSTIADASKSALIYAEQKKAPAQLGDAAFGLCFTTAELAKEYTGRGVVGVCENPRAAFATLADRLHSVRPLNGDGVHADAQIGEKVDIHPSATIGADAVIGAGAQIGPNVVIGPGVELGVGSSIGAGTTIMCALIGDGFVGKPGARLGQAGFGFVETVSGLTSVPQVGRLVIGDAVEIGANTTIDRGALGDTTIGAGTKIDNLVQIGHNVQIGRYCVVAAQVGIAGSTIVDDGVMIGGQAGLADHLKVGGGARIAAKAGVMSDIPAGETWGGYPARPSRRWLKETAMLARLVKKKS